MAKHSPPPGLRPSAGRVTTRGRKSKSWEDVVELLATYWDDHDGCWSWRGFSEEKGPRVYFAGKNCSARKLSYCVNYGAMPKAVTPTCGSTRCSNPAHLKEGHRSKGGRPSKITPEILAELRGVARGDSVACPHRVLTAQAEGDFETIQTRRLTLKKKPL